MPDIHIGAEIAGCRIEKELGRGGMGIVYRAEQLRLGRKVALKLIAPDLAQDVQFRHRFERESRLAASIDHPNVVPLYEAGEDSGVLYIIMRLVRGTDLRTTIMRDGRIMPLRIARITNQVASALDAAHSTGLVHRDIKPGNVLVEDESGQDHAYLSDFGLTKRLASESGITRTGTVLGTVDYLAPEQIEGSGAVDARADVYALACLLFHGLTGQVPYPRSEDMATMYAHVQLPPPSARDLVADLPVRLDEVIRRGMAKQPDDRFQSAGDLGRAALAAAQGVPVTVPERSVAAGAAAATQMAAAAPTRAEPVSPPHPVPEDPVHPVPVTPPTGVVAQGRRRNAVPIAAVGVALVSIGVAVGTLVATGVVGGNGTDRSSNQTIAVPSSTETDRATTSRTTEGSDTQKSSPSRPRTTYAAYRPASGGYSARVPAGEAWSREPEQVINDAIYRTSFHGPQGLDLLIDYTPDEPARFAQRDKCSTTSHPEFPLAERCVFSGGSLPQCQATTCVDYLLNGSESGPGYGVLVGGGELATARTIARRVADSVRAR